MNADQNLADRQGELAAFVEAMLRHNPARLSFVKIAQEGRRLGVFGPDDVRRCQRASKLPEWLVNRVGASGTPAFSSAFTVTPLDLPSPHPRHPARLVETGPVRLVVQNHNRMAIAPDGLIEPMSPQQAHWLRERYATMTKVRPLSGTTLDVVVPGGPLLSHFLFDALPSILALRQVVDLSTIDHFLFASLRAPFHAETLARLGIDPARCLTRGEDGAAFDAERVLWVPPLRHGWAASPALYRAVKDLFAPAVPDPSAPERVFISRSKARRRRIIDEEALWPLLTARGYRIVHFEDMGVAGAAALLHRARHIIGLHGAGFANIAFAPAGCRVSEIHGPHISQEYATIAATLDMTHDTYACHGIARSEAGDSLSESASDVSLTAAELAPLLLD